MKSSRTIFLYGTLCLLGFIAAQANPNESNDEVICPSGWYRIHRGCYMFIVEELNWDDALEHCKDHSGELTSLHSWNEKEAVYKYIVSNYEDIQRWWVGLQKNRTANQWMWLDNHPLDTNVLAWLNPGQMSTTKEACGVVDKSKARLHAAPNRCTSERPFICEYHNIIPRSTEETITEASTVATTVVSESTTQSSVESTTQSSGEKTAQTVDKCHCGDAADGVTSNSIDSHDERLKKRNQELITDADLYQKYLQSEIDANNAKVVYYSQVTKLYQEALVAQSQYYSRYQIKLDLEITQLKQKPNCN